MDLILQDLDKIDQFHHNYEMMTHGETSRSGSDYLRLPVANYIENDIHCMSICEFEPGKVTRNVLQKMQC